MCKLLHSRFLGADLSLQCKTQMHWHAHRVGALGFSSEGTYLLSGGEEAVLVVWQTATAHKRFLPRLGAPLVGLGLDAKDSLYYVAGEDNSVRIVDAAAFVVTQTVQGFKRPPQGAAGLVVDPHSKLVCCSAAMYRVFVLHAMVVRYGTCPSEPCLSCWSEAPAW